MKKIYFALLCCLTLFQLSAFAQMHKINVPDLDVPQLIFTEIQMNRASSSYVELTNVGAEPIDLSKFSLSSIDKYGRFSTFTDTEMEIAVPFEYKMSLAPIRSNGTVSMLPAGESIVLMNVYDKLVEDGLPIHNIAMLSKADYHFHSKELYIYDCLNRPEWQAFGFDSIESGFESNHKTPIGIDNTIAYLLEYKYINSEGNEELVYVDQFKRIYRSHFRYPAFEYPPWR